MHIYNTTGVPLQLLPQFVKRCYSDDPDVQFESIIAIHNFLSVKDPRLDYIIKSGIACKSIIYL